MLIRDTSFIFWPHPQLPQFKAEADINYRLNAAIMRISPNPTEFFNVCFSPISMFIQSIKLCQVVSGLGDSASRC